MCGFFFSITDIGFVLSSKQNKLLVSEVVELHLAAFEFGLTSFVGKVKNYDRYRVIECSNFSPVPEAFVI